jgi:hypothetical protein
MQKHTPNIHSCISVDSNITLCDAKLRLDAVRGQLWLLADHARHGIEIPDDLIEALLFRVDRDLIAVSDSITSELCREVTHG